MVTAKSPGTTTITAKTINGLTDNSTITVIGAPTITPTIIPTSIPQPTKQPTVIPTAIPTKQPTVIPTQKPTATPTKQPTIIPTATPTRSLIYKFNYDENNLKPKMTCNTYTATDRTRLEALLWQAVDRAGRGTRAGVVEAARFLVGGLNYKVPYLGPKTVNSELGRYDKLGLNIGNSKAWGCQVSGWTQGMDCTHFVYWAIINGGLQVSTVNPQKSAVPFKDNVDKVRVGDFLLTLSDGSVSWTYSHTAIIIGEDNNYFYVAEAKGIGTGVIKLSKANLPLKKQEYGMVSTGQYPSDGKITNMWNE
jgi:hypothetical protein